jgi:hypothetical protein
MAKKVTFTLTLPQLDQLLTLLRDAHDEGSYYGNREMYWARHYAIVKALEDSRPISGRSE